MNREKGLVENTVILAIGRFAPKLLSIITLPLLTAELSKSDYGTWDLISTMISLVMPIVTLQIQSAAFRFLIERRGKIEECKKIVSNIYLFTLPVSFIAAACLFFVFNNTVGTRIIISLYFLMDILFLSTSQIVRGLGQNKTYSIASILISVINVAAIVLTVKYIGTGLFGVVLSTLIANAVGLIYMLRKVHIWEYISLRYFSRETILEMISYSWPMIPNNLSNWALSLSDRLIITAALGVEANAIYAVANKIPNLLSIAQVVFVMAWQENASLAVNDKDADQYYTKMFDRIFSLLVGFTALLIAFTPIMFAILIKGDYGEAYYQMPILFLGMFFYCISAFQGGIYIAHKKTKSVGITTVGAAIINIVVDLCLVNVIGISAGSLSTLVAYLFLYIFRLKGVQKFQNISYNLKKQFGLLMLITLLLVFCFINSLWANMLNMIMGITLFFVLNWRLIHSLYKFFLAKLRT